MAGDLDLWPPGQERACQLQARVEVAMCELTGDTKRCPGIRCWKDGEARG